MQFNVHEAKTQLSRLLALVEQGEEVVIMRDGKPVANLVPHRPQKAQRKLGALTGSVQLPEGWDKPMTDEQVDAFIEGKPW